MTNNLGEHDISRSHFVGLLKQDFQFRRSKNASYSIRSYAKCLNIDQSYLTKILNGTRSPSASLIAKTNKRLRQDWVQNEKKNPSTETDHQRIEDSFHLISEWYHFALLELIRTKNFVADEKWICRRLGINQTQLQLSVARLMRLGFLEVQNKKWTAKSSQLTWSNNAETSEARRLLQKQFSLMSLMAIDDVDFMKRDHSSLTISIDPSLIPELKQRLTDFRRSLNQFLTQNQSQASEVYQFTFSFFPISQSAPEKRP